MEADRRIKCIEMSELDDGTRDIAGTWRSSML